MRPTPRRASARGRRRSPVRRRGGPSALAAGPDLSWKVTVRHGSDVSREKLDSLDEALVLARGFVDEVRRQDRLPTISMLREFTPDQRVAARIEISGPGLIRSPEGGIDVMGDGAVIAYTGTIRKEPIEADTLDELLDRLRAALDPS